MPRILKAIRRIGADAFGHYLSDDGPAMASHVALSTLMAIFPFLIFATSLASFLGANAFAGTAVHLIFDTWPQRIAGPIADEVKRVLTEQHGGILTVSFVAAAYFASNGVEAMRVSLNRAYRISERRSFVFCRLQSLAFVLVATLGMMAISLLLVLAPLAVQDRDPVVSGGRPVHGDDRLLALPDRDGRPRLRPPDGAYLAACPPLPDPRRSCRASS